ncbi:hypothetical protein [Desulfosarcina ovata]|uniref:EF-hand domain-containing protein n=1 Tax=Desulfosarcina ovata subsp. ovata TaxID=2752305 RepID=A0A5K8AGN8_9BACT|nr:hypothetical protein [Desulfosarcina ovata]BBO91669.1 hypothetical protein DSCOOX_48490 [Desulfosarcina ovata subsp. ovata]
MKKGLIVVCGMVFLMVIVLPTTGQCKSDQVKPMDQMQVQNKMQSKEADPGKVSGTMKQMKANQGQGTRFMQMDANGDGKLSYEELKGQVGDVGRNQFKNADTNGDGLLDHDEWAKTREDFGFGTGKGKNRK